MQPLVDALLTRDPRQRERLAQALLAMGVLAAGVAAMHWFVAIGQADAQAVRWWSLLTLAGMVLFFALIRTGLSHRFGEPSLTVPQMLFALTSAAAAYSLVGAGRGAVFPVVMTVFMFGIFVATPRQLRWVSVYAVALFGVVMGLCAWREPARYPWRVELGHFVLVATMLPAVSILAARLCRMRHRSRQHRAELAAALVRLREQSTRDELTGLINRRHMQALIEQEHQRCARSGQTFCLAVLDIDQLRTVNGAHGHEAGDAVLRALAEEAARQVRGSDVLARQAGDQFLLMLPDTRAAMARGGVERLHEQLGAVRVALPGGAVVGVTLSAGLAEHHAGETVAQTLDRVQAARAQAQAQGGGRVVLAA
jgi:diguanylate cyclase (GGDEF)-like protein